MNEQVDRLVEKVWAKYRSAPNGARLMIAISGVPGSGKTELASVMAKRINALSLAERGGSSSAASSIAIAVPMDGFHLTRAQLAQMPDPVYAAARRGAEFTFDGAKFVELVRALRDERALSAGSRAQRGRIGQGDGINGRNINNSSSNNNNNNNNTDDDDNDNDGDDGGYTVYAPSFDHAIKDPVADEIAIPSSCRIVFFEGNYLSLDKEPWDEAARMMDELWFVDVDFEVARKRLVRRHVLAGIAEDEAAADRRVRENDLVNGQEIVDRRMEVQEVIESRHDPAWER